MADGAQVTDEVTSPRPAVTDGRHLRRQANRERVIAALLELFSEGVVAPTMAEVAFRAGISQRSIFRYFVDTDDLVRAAAAQRVRALTPLAEIAPPYPDSLDERATLLAAQRAELFEAAGPIARVVRVHAVANATVSQQLDAARASLRASTEAIFAPELDRTEHTRASLLAALDVLFSFESWELLRFDQRLAVDEAAVVLADAARALLGPPATR